MKKNAYKTLLITFIGSFVIMIMIAIYIIYLYGGDFTSYYGRVDGISDPDGFTIEVAPRGREGDTWDKISHKDGKEWNIKGIIYSAYITNNMDTEVPNWEMRIDITQDMWLNQAWCGTMEIHQGDKQQTLDLREAKYNDVKLEVVPDADILIPLHDGDYIIYHPSVVDGEAPISPNGTMDIGFIIYVERDVPTPEFEYVDIACDVSKKYTAENPMKLFRIVAIAWLLNSLLLVAFFLETRNNRKRLEREKTLVEQTMNTISSFVDAKDQYTAGHSQRVAEVSALIAKTMGWDEERCQNIYYCGLLHDCGKIGVPDGILNKPGRLNFAEFDIVKTHSSRGYEMLKPLNLIPEACIVARHHHERYDGTGYPDRLRGEEIPKMARILTVADAFDAMSSTRVYRNALSKEYILEQFTTNRGTQFDPEIVDIFLKLVDEDKIKI